MNRRSLVTICVGVIILCLAVPAIERTVHAWQPATLWERFVLVDDLLLEGPEILTPPVDVRGWNTVTWHVTVIEGVQRQHIWPQGRVFPQQPFTRVNDPMFGRIQIMHPDANLVQMATVGTEMRLEFEHTPGVRVAVSVMLEK